MTLAAGAAEAIRQEGDRMRGFVGMQRPQTVAEQVANVLREAIADGSLAAGTALRQLDAEGIVQIHPT
jgi:DNA-binding GntR family transcriptional regulator